MSTPHITPLAVKEQKVTQSASSKIDNIVRQLYLPMLCMPTPERTSFLTEDAVVDNPILDRISHENPEALATESNFMDYVALLYNRTHNETSFDHDVIPDLNTSGMSV